MLTNQNYFGNFPELDIKPILPLNGNKFYEELGCVGYHPQQEHLEAVVYVKQPSGYGSGICGAGTPEFVRFYLSFDNGASWTDQGLTSFQAHDIPQGTEGVKRLEYAVSLKVNPNRRWCFLGEHIIKARAILSWNFPPPANSPNWIPAWGDRQDANIQVEPIRIFFPTDLFKIKEVKFPPQLQEIMPIDIPVKTNQKTLGVQELAVLYKGKDVPAHRFAFKELSTFIHANTALNFDAVKKLLPGIQINPNILDVLFPKTDGNTNFEELTCIGLDPNSPDTLVGVIEVKLPNGYSGGVCTNGSKEYVAFWADFDGNGSFETYLGTGSVSVYDLGNPLPAGGVNYAVRLPVDLSKFRQPCSKGAKVVRIRAIMSWNVAPPPGNPNFVPTWGNREETLINISPFAGVPAGKIAILGGIPTSMIDPVSGTTTPDAVFATNNIAPDAFGRPCSFGGRVSVQGAPMAGHTYLIEVIPDGGGAPTEVVTDLVLTRFDGTTFTHSANPVTKRFAYVPFSDNVNGLLGQWDTTGDDKWRVRLSTFDGGGNLVGVDEHKIQLDNTWPDAQIDITLGGGNCGKFRVGDVLTGTFVATDLNLGSFSIGVEPAINPPGVGVPSPSSGLVNTAPGGDTWTLNTAGMGACGYIIRVVAVDRVIVNSQSVGHHSPDSVGFCLE